jgi:hypothetical protein
VSARQALTSAWRLRMSARTCQWGTPRLLKAAAGWG